MIACINHGKLYGYLFVAKDGKFVTQCNYDVKMCIAVMFSVNFLIRDIQPCGTWMKNEAY
jgi:hypothetical protein